jgi:hypothetical protein
MGDVSFIGTVTVGRLTLRLCVVFWLEGLSTMPVLPGQIHSCSGIAAAAVCARDSCASLSLHPLPPPQYQPDEPMVLLQVASVTLKEVAGLARRGSATHV